MKLAVFSAKPYDKVYLARAGAAAELDVEIVYHDFPLNPETVSLASGAAAVCVFVNDTLTKEVLTSLHSLGVRAILLRCAGYNNVDLKTASDLDMFVANVPAYSPEAVAEFAVALVQTLNRNTHRAYNRWALLGRARSGSHSHALVQGFGCELLAYDPFQNPEFEKYGKYTTLSDLLSRADVVSLHCPLLPSTRHIIDDKTLHR
ncbi:hypothetical protein RRF57_011972 [Xylaria bambusicola]|uniref:D-lactate dehydrogenase n=1 Tax=Xylaria bambusicola TaxID=326684 RepID=A0AAN7Z458_9PEZI